MWRATAALIAGILALIPAAGLAGEAVVRVQDGRVWAAFDNTPTPDAITAIKQATGVHLALPASARRQTLSLSANAMPFEQFVRRVLENFDVGGFALVYNAGGRLDQVIVVEKGHDAPAPAESSLPRVNAPVSPAAAARPSVPFLIRSTEAAAMKLGSPGQIIVVQSRPFATTRTPECNGQPGDYPVQTVLVTDAGSTYITSITVCTSTALSPGERLMPAPPTTTAQSGEHSRFVGQP